MDSNDTLVIYPSRWKWGLSIIFCVVMIWLIHVELPAEEYFTDLLGRAHAEKVKLGFMLLIGSVALVGGLILCPGSTFIKLGPKGFTVSRLFLSRTYVWNDIENFCTYSIWIGIGIPYILRGKLSGRSHRIGFKLHESQPGIWKKLRRKMYGVDEKFPQFGWDTNNLADLLNEWNDKYSTNR